MTHRIELADPQRRELAEPKTRQTQHRNMQAIVTGCRDEPTKLVGREEARFLPRLAGERHALGRVSHDP